MRTSFFTSRAHVTVLWLLVHWSELSLKYVSVVLPQKNCGGEKYSPTNLARLNQCLPKGDCWAGKSVMWQSPAVFLNPFALLPGKQFTVPHPCYRALNGSQDEVLTSGMCMDRKPATVRNWLWSVSSAGSFPSTSGCRLTCILGRNGWWW